MSCDCVTGEQSGNEESYIPLKVGQPMSTPCERATVVGAIPSVVRFAGFTLVRGGVPDSKISNAGISNIGTFFKNREGCFYDKNAQLPGCSNC